MMRLRPATPADLQLLHRWDAAPHVTAANGSEDWGWETELARRPTWREQLIVEVDGAPIGFVQSICYVEDRSFDDSDCAVYGLERTTWDARRDC